jgi:hypothetical protein
VYGIFEGLWGLAQAAAASGEARRAARLFGAAARLREASEVHLMEIEFPEFDEHLEATRSRFEEASWMQPYEEGHAMMLEETIAYALEDEEAGPRAGETPA